MRFLDHQAIWKIRKLKGYLTVVGGCLPYQCKWFLQADHIVLCQASFWVFGCWKNYLDVKTLSIECQVKLNLNITNNFIWFNILYSFGEVEPGQNMEECLGQGNVRVYHEGCNVVMKMSGNWCIILYWIKWRASTNLICYKNLKLFNPRFRSIRDIEFISICSIKIYA